MGYSITLDTKGSVQKAVANLGAIAPNLVRAKASAARALVRYVDREVQKVLKTVTKSSSTKPFKGRVYWDIGKRRTLQVWIGTDPIGLHHIGKVSWDRYVGEGSRPRSKPKTPGRGRGARVAGYGVVPGSFAWAPPQGRGVTMAWRRIPGTAMKSRRGRSGAKHNEKIGRLQLDIHRATEYAVEKLLPAVGERWEVEVERAIRSQLARSGLYAQDIADVRL